eukprot:357272-Chlamydomonas_euryale.AAC.7
MRREYIPLATSQKAARVMGKHASVGQPEDTHHAARAHAFHHQKMTIQVAYPRQKLKMITQSEQSRLQRL